MTEFSKNQIVFVPDGLDAPSALRRTTDLCFAAHQDDIELMAYPAIAECYQKTDRWFAGCTVTDGAGSPRNGIYGDYTDEQMKQVRAAEQNKAAMIGEYAIQLQLGFPSSIVKDAQAKDVVESFAAIIAQCRPQTIYTHNPADKHDTHVAVFLRVVQAIRSLPQDIRPQKLYGMEVWRSLDWVNDNEKTIFDATPHPNLAAALVGVYDSQIMGGKRYDAAILGRRAANATFYESHGTDTMTDAAFAIDLSALIEEDTSVPDVMNRYIESFKNDVAQRIQKLDGGNRT